MKRIYSSIVVSGFLGLLLVAALVTESENGKSLVPSSQAQTGTIVAPQIEGTWLLTVTPPLESGQPPFQVLVSFGRGGVFLASAETGMHGLPAQYGSWMKSGSAGYITTAMAFGNGPGGELLTFKVKSLFTLLGEDVLEGTGSLAICDPTGNNCNVLPGCSVLSATRVKIEAPSCAQ